MSENNKFRVVSIGGFHKDDVLSYIASIDHKVAVLRDEFAVEKKNMQKDIEDAKEVKTAYEELKEENEKLKADAERLKMQNQDLNMQVSNIDVVDENAEIRNLKALNDELRNKVSSMAVENSEINKIKDALVRVELEAHVRAQEMEIKTKQEAEMLVNQAKTVAKQLVDEATVSVQMMQADKERKWHEFDNDIKALTEKSLFQIEKMDELLLSIAEKNEELRTKIHNVSLVKNEQYQVVQGENE